MKNILLTPVEFRVNGQTLCMNVSVYENENIRSITDRLEYCSVFFYTLHWADGAKKEPIPLTKEVLEMYDVVNLYPGLKIGKKKIKGSYCKYGDKIRICTEYKNMFLALDYLHEFEIVYKLLKGEELTRTVQCN